MDCRRRFLSLAILAASVPAAAVGFPDFDLDTNGFLVPVADTVQERRAAAVESPYRARSRALAEHLRRAGHLTARTAFHPVTDPEHADSPAYVTYDFPRGICDVFIGDEALAAQGFDREFILRFVMYHELSHCQLYAAPRDLKPFPELDEKANRMLSDFVRLEFFRPDDGSGFKANGYNVYHETYADVKAVGLLLSEGYTREQVMEIVRFRERTPFSFMSSHDNAGVFAQVLDKPWASYGPARLDAEARAIAEVHLRKNIFAHLYSAFVWEHTPFVEVLANSLGHPASSLRYAGTDPKTRAGVEAQLAQGAASPDPVWRLYADLLRKGLEKDALIDAFFSARYGAVKNGLAAEDLAVRRMLRAISR